MTQVTENDPRSNGGDPSRGRPASRRLALAGGLGTMAAVGIFGRRWLAQSGMAATPAIDLSREALFQDPKDPVLGNPLGALPIAEFFDYRCPYCHRMHPVLQELLREDRGIRFVAKEWPLFGGPSITAARTALASNWQGKFVAMHDALFAAPGALDDARVRALAEQAGVDMSRLDHDLSTRGAELDAMLSRVSVQARALGLQGTPAFVIGPYLVPGAMSYDSLVKTVANARTKLKLEHAS